MNNGFEVTQEDMEVVLDTHGIELPADRLEELFEDLDTDAISDVAMKASTDLMEQTDAALSEIETRLIDSGVIPAGQQRCFE